MTYPSRMLWAAACSQLGAAERLAADIQGTMYADHRDDTSALPFAALVTGVFDDPAFIADQADAGLYVICERTIKAGRANIFGLFPMIANPALTHKQADAHWRDNHAPLALHHHAYMTEYLQLSVVHTLSGPAYDGFALCGFDNIEDLKERFFSEPDSTRVIAEDVAKFADPTQTPRRLLATPHYFS